MPFCILAGLTALAGGLVEIVEIGAAGRSLSEIEAESEPSVTAPSADYPLAKDQYRDIMGQQAAVRRNDPEPKNQVAYQLSLQLDAQRERIEPLATQMSAIPESETAGSSDVLDWSMLERGSEDPRSTLQRGTSTRLLFESAPH